MDLSHYTGGAEGNTFYSPSFIGFENQTNNKVNNLKDGNTTTNQEFLSLLPHDDNED